MTQPYQPLTTLRRIQPAAPTRYGDIIGRTPPGGNLVKVGQQDQAQPAGSSFEPMLSTLWSIASVAGTGIGAYHGYKRHNGSIGWAIGWALLGGLFPIITIPVAVAQGFPNEGKKK